MTSVVFYHYATEVEVLSDLDLERICLSIWAG